MTTQIIKTQEQAEATIGQKFDLDSVWFRYMAIIDKTSTIVDIISVNDEIPADCRMVNMSSWGEWVTTDGIEGFDTLLRTGKIAQH